MMIRQVVLFIGCMSFSIGCGQSLPSESKAKNSEEKVEQPESLEKVGDFFITAKTKDLLNKVPINVYELLTKELQNGTLVQAEYMGIQSIGYSGANQRAGTSNDWTGFYIGKAVGFEWKDGKPVAHPDASMIKLRSFKVRAVVDYSGAYESYSKEATPGETKILKDRGYIK
jgi:hypothetical protein